MNNIKQQILQANQYYATGDLEKAEKICKRVLLKAPQVAENYNLLALIYYNKKEFPKAIYNFNKAIKLDLANAMYYYNLAFVYLAQNDLQKTKQNLQTAITCNLNYTPAYLTLASLYLTTGGYNQAEDILLQILQLQPDTEKALELLGTVYEADNKSVAAKSCYQKVLLINKNNVTALINLGKIYTQAGYLQEGLGLLLQASKLTTNNANVYNNLANVLLLLNRPKDAKDQFAAALRLEPRRLAFYVNYALTINILGESFAAKAMLEKLFAEADKFIVNQHESANYFFAKANVGLALAYCYSCDWVKLAAKTPEITTLLLENIAKREYPILVPYHALMLSLPADILRSVTAYYVSRQLEKKEFVDVKIAAIDESTIDVNALLSKRKIRLAYLSPDLGDHAVGLLLRNLLSFHDREKFVVYALSLRNFADNYAEQIKQSVDFFVDLSNFSDDKIIAEIQHFDFDVLIDLAGYTVGGKPAVQLAKLARRQVNYFGFPYPMENPAVRYFIGNNILTPPNVITQFGERVILMPAAWYACEPFFPLTQLPSVTKAEYSLPADKFIFCCFSKPYRFSLALMQCWAKILAAVPNSILWLSTGGTELDNVLLKFFNDLEISSERLVFSKDERLSVTWRHRLADLWLDPFNFTTGTGTILSIWAELPVISLAGGKSQARVAAAVLHAAGLTELIVHTEQEYTGLAVKLAIDKEFYQRIKTKVQQAKNSDLFNPTKFIAELEQIYCEILAS